MKRVIVTLIVFLLMPLAALAQEEVGGTYVDFDLEETIIELPDGSRLVQRTFGQFGTTSGPDSPFSNVKGRCMSDGFFSESGEVVANAGACVFHNPDGDTYWTWWRLEEAGTTDCPLACGTSGIFNGTGAFDGVTSSGTWKTTAPYPDGTGAGVWQSKFERK